MGTLENVYSSSSCIAQMMCIFVDQCTVATHCFYRELPTEQSPICNYIGPAFHLNELFSFYHMLFGVCLSVC